MRKLLLSIAGLLLAGSTGAQCTDIFISEYVEGWSNNKAIELYNPTSQSIDLSNYFLSRYRNGTPQAEKLHSVQLSGTIAPYSTYVAVIDKRDAQGTGQEAPVWDSLQAKADGFYCPDYNTSNAMYFNGDDGLILYYGDISGLLLNDLINNANVPGLQVIDVFGKLNEQPLNEQGLDSNPVGGWSTNFPYTGDATGGTIITRDYSLIRKASIQTGQNNLALSFFNPLAEWDSISATIVRLDMNGDTVFSQAGNPIQDGNWSSLGTHDCECDPLLGLDDNQSKVLALYPNPTRNGEVQLSSSMEINEVKVYSSNGALVFDYKNKASTHHSLNLSDLEKGIYILNYRTKTGLVGTERLIIE